MSSLCFCFVLMDISYFSPPMQFGERIQPALPVSFKLFLTERIESCASFHSYVPE